MKWPKNSEFHNSVLYDHLIMKFGQIRNLKDKTGDSMKRHGRLLGDKHRELLVAFQRWWLRDKEG